MAKKQKQVDRRAFKKEGEELQQWLIFRKRGSKVESGKKYNRQKFKRGEWEMVRCPNCGSTAQVRLQEVKEQELTCYTIEVTRTYKCGCGEVFIVKEYKNNTWQIIIPML